MNWAMWSSSIMVACIEITSPAFAGDIRSPFDLESTSVLPAGVRNPRFKNLFMTIEDKYGDAGGTEPLGLKLNKQITWADIKKDQTQLKKEQIDLILSKTKQSNANACTGDNCVAGTTTGQVNSFADVKIPVLAFGVTDKLTLALAVPITHIEISADTGMVKTPDGQAFATTAVNTSEFTGNDVIKTFNGGVNTKLKDYGYEPIQNQNVTGIGDLQLVGKYLISDDTIDSYAVKGTVVLPTGRTANPDRVVDAPLGDGQWKAGPGAVWDHKLTPELHWTQAGSYLMALPSTMEKRIPSDPSSSVTKDKEVVSRWLQHTLSLGTSFTYDVPKIGMNFGTGYTYQYQSELAHTGSRFDSVRYHWLDDQTPPEYLHSMIVTVGFSTVDWYRKKKFVYPFEAKFVFSHPLGGRNTGTNDVYAGELVAFF